ncbi:hypothetical protein PRUPE_2G089800 [Prunus persica]|uniref:Uncharacterized protein n=1 Tax=Prunus persica TaxID=3760 RepID=A0A251QDD8_PRUPE|nr:hypothetical protein PRUPE_2G089800 [Prunus persica]
MPKKSKSFQQKLIFLNLIQTSTSVNMIHENKRSRQNKYEVIHEDPHKKNSMKMIQTSTFHHCNFSGRKKITMKKNNYATTS